MEAKAYAKVNLSLHVGGLTPSGLHEVRGLFQSIDWHDILRLDAADEDRLSGPDGREVIDGTRNLAWRAIAAVRTESGSRQALSLELVKDIPVAAGLGGGSADAAAALMLAKAVLGVSDDATRRLAEQLGSDVPFCLDGGLAVVSGTGDRVEGIDSISGYGLALVVPPVEISTADVYATWDRLDPRSGPEVTGRDLPPGLRDLGPFANDLYPAAVALAPTVDEWRAELSARWGRPVMLTGSGPTLYAFFLDVEEAGDALEDVPVGARATRAAVPVDHGWQLR